MNINDQPAPKPSRLPGFLYAVLFAILIFQALLFVFHGIQVIRFPHDVDNGEGFLLWESLEYSQGRSPYQPIDQPPYLVANYPPLYPLLCSLGTGILGPTFAVGRSISLICSLGIAFGIAWIVYRQSHQKSAALIAALFFIGTYHVYSWGVFHRVDMLALLFSVLALGACVAHLHWLWILFACVLALLTRQTMLAAPLAIGFYWISQHRIWPAFRFWILLALTMIFITLILNYLTMGEYFRHIVVYNKNFFKPETLIIYFSHLWRLYPIISLFGIFYFLRSIQQRRFNLPFWFLLFSLIPAFMVGKIGSAQNYFLELILALAWCLGLVQSELRILDSGTKSWIELLLPLLLLYQAVTPLHITPVPYIIPVQRFDFSWTPTREDRKREEVLDYYLQPKKGLALIEDPGIALQVGQPLIYQPFICTQLEEQGLWNPAPIIKRIEAKEFAVLALRVNMDEATRGSDRFSDRMVQAIQENYSVVEIIKGQRDFYLHRPKK